MRIDVIGSGNVATHLLRALTGLADVRQVIPRSLEGLRPDADIRLICVSDSAIREVAERLPASDAVTAHTSGATPLSAIADIHTRCGVFYPLQTFSKDTELEYSDIPFLIEGSDAATTSLLSEVASLISRDVREADSEMRQKIHVASVFACNFTNHLWTLADEYMEKEGLDFKILLPLIRESYRKIRDHRPGDVQTGPASRKDYPTIDRHLAALGQYHEMKEIYRILSSSIISRTNDKETLK